jgi:hypothetical protein
MNFEINLKAKYAKTKMRLVPKTESTVSTQKLLNVLSKLVSILPKEFSVLGDASAGWKFWNNPISPCLMVPLCFIVAIISFR